MRDRFAQTGRTTKMLWQVIDYAINHSCSDCVVICRNMNHCKMIADMLSSMLPSLKRSMEMYFDFPNDSNIIFISEEYSKHVMVGKHYDYVVKDHATQW